MADFHHQDQSVWSTRADHRQEDPSHSLTRLGMSLETSPSNIHQKAAADLLSPLTGCNSSASILTCKWPHEIFSKQDGPPTRKRNEQFSIYINTCSADLNRRHRPRLNDCLDCLRHLVHWWFVCWLPSHPVGIISGLNVHWWDYIYSLGRNSCLERVAYNATKSRIPPPVTTVVCPGKWNIPRITTTIPEQIK